MATVVVGDENEYVGGDGWISDDSSYYGLCHFYTFSQPS